MDRAEHSSALLNQRLRSTYRSLAGDVGNLLLAGRNHSLCSLLKKTKQLEQDRRRRIEGHWEGYLLDVVYPRCALNLHHLSHINRLALTAYTRPLELQHRRSIVDMGRVEQRPQSACKRRCKPSYQVRQSYCVSAAPRNKLELNQPVQFGQSLITLFPVPV